MIGVIYGYLVKHGGIGRYISEILLHSSNKSKIELLTIENDLSLPRGIRVNRVNCERNKQFLNVLENLSFSEKVREYAKRLNLLHSHGVYNFNPDIYTAHICIKKYFEKVIAFGGGDELPIDLDTMVSLERNIVKNSGIITTVSGKVADEISESYGVDRNRILLIKGASRLKDVSSREGDQRKILNIGFVGGNLKAKGITQLVKAVNVLKSKGINILVVGAGTNSDIENYFLKHAKFSFDLKGKIELGLDFYKKLDIYICPSIYEAYSLSTLEAMSLGVPVVSSDLNGVFYDNPNENLARVKDLRNEEELAQVVEQTFRDKEFRKEIVKAGKNISSQNTWKIASKAYDTLYSSI